MDTKLPKYLADDIGTVDKIVVHKHERKLLVFHKGELLKSYPISLGANAIGHKTEEGDLKTPEGEYTIDWKHPNSSYYLALRISYPNANDRLNAKEKGVNPGGDIMIHGMPNGFAFLYPVLKNYDWTEGCIAVSNTAMQELVSAINIKTPIIIKP